MTVISCDCSVEHEDGMGFFSDTWRTARKEHVCCECGEPIRKGERHQYSSGVWDGAWGSFRTCRTCVAIRERYCPHGWVYGDLAEQIYDCIEFDYRVVPGGVKPS